MNDRKSFLTCVILLFFVSLLILVIAWVKNTTTLTFPLDDAFIHAVYARNLVRGHFWEFNIGERAMAETAPLWVFALSLPYAFGLNGFWAALIVNGVLFVLLGVIIYRFALFVVADRSLALITSMLVACTPPIVYAALSGMETMLSVILVWSALVIFVSKKPDYALISSILGVSVWARPDYGLLFVLFWLFAVPRNHKLKSLVGLIPIAAFAMFHILLWGKPAPETFYAKVSDEGLIWALRTGNLREICLSIFFYPVRSVVSALGAFYPYIPPMALFAIVGICYIVRKNIKKMRQLILIALLYIVIRGILITPSAYQWGRYIAWVFPLMVFVAAVGLQKFRYRAIALSLALISLAAFFLWRFWAPWLSDAVLGGKIMMPGKNILFGWSYFPELWSVVALASFSAFLLVLLRDKLLVFTGILFIAMFLCVYGAGFSIALDMHKISGLQVSSARWCGENLPAGTRILVHDIGAVGFYAPKLVVRDIWGILTSEALVPEGGANPILALKIPHNYFLTFECYDPKTLGVDSLYTPIKTWWVEYPTVGRDSSITLWQRR